jgi:hypothetical protein
MSDDEGYSSDEYDDKLENENKTVRDYIAEIENPKIGTAFHEVRGEFCDSIIGLEIRSRDNRATIHILMLIVLITMFWLMSISFTISNQSNKTDTCIDTFQDMISQYNSSRF